MVILENRDLQMNIVVLKKYFTILLKKEIKNEVLNNGKAIKELLKIYDKSEILDAVNDIYINGNRLEIPEVGKNSLILRYIEFGGEGVRSMHLISRCLKKVRRGVDVL